MRKFWVDLVPRRSTIDGRYRTLFGCIHALMSHQLRGLIQRSVDHLFRTLRVYAAGNWMRTGYDADSELLKRRPFITLNVSVVGKHCDVPPADRSVTAAAAAPTLYRVEDDDPNIVSMESPPTETKCSFGADFVLRNSGKMFVEPYLETLPDLFVGFFVKLIKVGNNVPRMEYYMTKGAYCVLGFW